MNTYEFFKAYVPINEKKRPLMKFKDVPLNELLTLEEAETHEGYAGILNENTVLIDVDDGEHAEKMFKIVRDLKLKTRVYKTTRGMHFLFLNNGTFSKDKGTNQRASSSHLKTVCGLHIDYKTGISNCLENLKIGGVYRSVIYDIEDGEEYETVPKFILPCYKIPTVKDENGKTVEDKTKDNFQLFGMKEGDGRNEALRDWKNYPFNKWNFSPEEIEEIFRNITNKYVFSEPLPEEEIETICRPEAFIKFDSSDGKKSKKKKNKKVDTRFTDENGKFRQSKLGDFLIGEYHVKSLDRVLYAFNGVCYESDLNTDILQKRMIELVPDLGRTKRLDVTDYMKLKSPKVERERGTKYICFKNGLLNLETFELVQSSPDVFIRNLIPHDYNPEAFSTRMNKALNDWCNNSDEIRCTLEEAVGYTLTSSTIGQSMFIIQGDKSNGKSSFFFVLQSILGEWNYSSCNMFELGRKFVLASMLDKTANIGDDISNSKISSETVSILKKVSTGNSVETEFKGKDRFKFVPCAKLWYSCNSFPIFNDETGALARRIILIPFLNTFDSTNRERGFEYTFTETDYQYFIRVAIDGLKRVITNNWNITPCSEGERLKEELVTHTDSVRMFLEVTDMKDIVNRSTEDVFDMYRKFCPVSERATVNELSKEIRRKYRLTTQPRTVKDLHGIPRKVRVYIRE